MKRILSYMAITAVFTACSEMYGPEQESTAVVNSEGVEITGISVTDNSVTFTLSPKGEASYYSYLVDQADAPQALDSSAVYELGYDGAVAEGTIKWTSEKTSSTVTVSNLEPNTIYQIYAVAGSPTGVPSSVVVANARTSDGVNPTPASFSAEGNVVTLSFSEGVTRGEGAVTVAYYATNTEAFSTDPQPAGTLTVAAEDIASDGSSMATITVKGAPAGALYTVSLAAGAFKDSAGNPTPALTSGVVIDEGTEKPTTRNIAGQMPTETFEIAKIETETFTDPTLPMQTTVNPEYDLAGYGDGNGKVVFKNSVKTTEIAMTAGSDFGLVQGALVIALPETPEPGDDVILTIEEGAFLDIYGNGNAEWADTLKYSYGYTMDDIVGNYEALGLSGYDGYTYYLSADADSFVSIAEDNTKEGCNVSISGIFASDTKIYGNFNFDSGILSIPDLQYLTEIQSMELYFANYSAEAPVEMSVTAPGEIQSTDVWMYYIPSVNSYVNFYVATQMTRQDQTSQTGQLKAQRAAKIDLRIKGNVTTR